MDVRYTMIELSRQQVEDLIRIMERAERYCSNARPVPHRPSRAELMAEPTDYYSGASGYAGATLRCAIQTLESALS